MSSKLVFVALAVAAFAANTSADKDYKIARARIESCPGCSLNRLPEVKKFIYEDVPKYEGVEFKKIHGAPPELVFLNEAEEELERIPLKELNRQECNGLLQSKGFRVKKESNGGEGEL